MLLAILIIVLGYIAVFAGVMEKLIATDVDNKKINAKFNIWWNSVCQLDRTSLSLEFVKKINNFLNSFFGVKYFSWRLFKRSFLIASGLLLVALFAFGVRDKQPFGASPWKAYSGSVEFIMTTTAYLTQSNNYADFRVFDMQELARNVNAGTNQAMININSNLLLFTPHTNGAIEIRNMSVLGNGSLDVQYYRFFRYNGETNQTTNSFGKLVTTSNPKDDLIRDIKKLRGVILEHDRFSYKAFYSIVFYIVLFTTNVFLFIGSLAFGRTVLKEIAASGRLITTASLLFTNFFFIGSVGLAVLFILTILAIPLFWLLIPALLLLADESVGVIVSFMYSSAIALMFLLGNSTLIVLGIALLPSIFAMAIGFMSFLLTWNKELFHWLISRIVINILRTNIYVVVGVMVTSVLALIELMRETFKLLF